jgi:hypothetical protein
VEVRKYYANRKERIQDGLSGGREGEEGWEDQDFFFGFNFSEES